MNLFTLKGNIGGNNTNNVSEYMALIYGMIICKLLNMENSKLSIYSDSKLLVSQITGKYKLSTPHISILNKALTELLDKFSYYNINHIFREFNTEADEMVNQAVKLEEQTIMINF